MSTVTAETLFNDFVYWRAHTAHARSQKGYRRPMKINKERKALFEAVWLWAKKKKVDPRRWLWGLFELRAWRFPPQMTKSHLMSEKIFSKYQNLTDDSVFQKRILDERRQIEESEGRLFDPNRDVHPTIENIKRRYLKEADGATKCMSRMYDHTLGYHPQSRVCIRCPLWQECLNRLERTTNFDVIALREGRITAEQAQQQEARRPEWMRTQTSFPSVTNSNPLSSGS